MPPPTATSRRPAGHRLLPVLILISLATSLALADPLAISAQDLFSGDDTIDDITFDTDSATDFNVVTSDFEPIKQAPTPPTPSPPSSGFAPLPPPEVKTAAVPKPLNPIDPKSKQMIMDDDDDDEGDEDGEWRAIRDLSDLLFPGRQDVINVGGRRRGTRSGGKSVTSADKLLEALQKARGNVKVGRGKRAKRKRRGGRRNKVSKTGRKRGKGKVSKRGGRGGKSRKNKRKQKGNKNKRIKTKGRKPGGKRRRDKRKTRGRRTKRRRTRGSGRSVFDPKASDIKARLKRIGRNVDATQTRLKSALQSHDKRLETLVNDLVAGRQDRKEEIRGAIMSLHEEVRKVGLQVARYEAKYAAKDHVLLMQLRSIEHQITAIQEDQANGAFQSDFDAAQVEARLAKLDTKRSEVLAKRALTRAKIIDIRARARQVQSKVKAVITRLKRKQKQGPGQLEVGASEHAIENIRKALSRMTMSVRRTQLCPRVKKSKGRRGGKRKQKRKQRQKKARDARRKAIKKTMDGVKARQQELLARVADAVEGGGDDALASADPLKALADQVRREQEARKAEEMRQKLANLASALEGNGRRRRGQQRSKPRQHAQVRPRSGNINKGFANRRKPSPPPRRLELGRRRFAVQDQLLAEEAEALMGLADEPPSANPNSNDSPIIIIANPLTAPTTPSTPAAPAVPPGSSSGQSTGHTRGSQDDSDDSKRVGGSGTGKGGKTANTRRGSRAEEDDDASKGQGTSRGTSGRNANANPDANSASNSNANPSSRGSGSTQSGKGSQRQRTSRKSEDDQQVVSSDAPRGDSASKGTRSPNPDSQSGSRPSQDDNSKSSRNARSAAPSSPRSSSGRGSSSSASGSTGKGRGGRS
ncbi:hypothetical protein BCR44DRAFT_1433012 [Catenaria anguillulae PL171]|uniref:Lebercilin domain-containing protein n=1 Tax=Catenaria anguillulae PL171 TaxID=765915 RepID=A0A1Y2HNQ8_9FUNG|nr:hypothetical protein BCR44DRAFT_1433012 [Catenaria anguillulae PL171]